MITFSQKKIRLTEVELGIKSVNDFAYALISTAEFPRG